MIATLALIAALIVPAPISFDCGIAPIPPIPPIGCIAVEPVCVCDSFGNCRTIFRCIRG